MEAEEMTPEEELIELRNTIVRLSAWIDDLQAGTWVTCVYCGHRYGPGETTPVSMADALKAHVEVCAAHPMSALKKENKQLRELLQLEKTHVEFEQKQKREIENQICDLRKAQRIAPGIWLQDQELIWEGEPDDNHDCDRMGCMTLRHAIKRMPLAKFIKEAGAASGDIK